MSYVESQLLPNEQIRYRAHLHRLMYAWPALVAVGGAVAAAVGRATPQVWIPSLALFVVAGAVLGARAVRRRTSEFAVTDTRVISKVGLVRRRTLETMLSKIEAIGVDQTIGGRLLGYGTITVMGTGGTKEEFSMIAAPLEFRKRVQGEIAAAETRSRGVAAPIASASLDRAERDCPFCAERILARANVCKHCGREVSAAQLSS